MSLIGKSLNEASKIIAYKDVYAVGSRVCFGSGDKSPYAMGRNGQAIIGVTNPQEVEAAFAGSSYEHIADAILSGGDYSTLLIGNKDTAARKFDRSRLVLACNSWVSLPEPLKQTGAVNRIVDFFHDISVSEEKVKETVAIMSDVDSGLENTGRPFSVVTEFDKDGNLVHTEMNLGTSASLDRNCELKYFQGAEMHAFYSRGFKLSGTKASLGTPSDQWDTVFAINNTISTSDERLKFIDDIPQEWIEAARAIKPIRFKWKHEIERYKNGERKEPRWHVGYGAQSVFQALQDAGVENPWECAFMCKDMLIEQNEAGDLIPLVDENGKQVERWGIRQVELNTLKLAAL